MTREEFLKVRFKVGVNPMGGYTIQDCGDVIECHMDKIVTKHRCDTLNEYEKLRCLDFNPPSLQGEIGTLQCVIYEMSKGKTLDGIKKDFEGIREQIKNGHNFLPRHECEAQLAVDALDRMFKAIEVFKKAIVL